MILVTVDHRARLLKNGQNSDQDHVPLVKLFNPFGIGTWLVTQMEPDGDILFGLADLGFPELGCFSLSEIAGLRLPFGMGIERDIFFRTDQPISVWAKVARETGGIMAAEHQLASSTP
ncbi:MAG: DUF2958 domain-containing protein [Paracoccus sp. (in: a-proteobacteria)]|nr:DUF2958 domain-containing protein [Paracoccus sp. (in: a-proteobacteria)]